MPTDYAIVLQGRQTLLTIPASPTSQCVDELITVANRQWLISFAQHDAARIATIYAADAQLLPAYSAAIVGRNEIQAFWQGCLDMGICAMPRSASEVDCLGETMNEIGEYRFLDGECRVLDIGKYVMIWKKEGARWQIHRQIWTSNLPASSIGNKR